MFPVVQPTRWARAALLALALVAPATARADVVQPPPRFCPPGTEGTTSHSGPQCTKSPPRNCPRGWHGILGGTCMLSPCSADSECPDGNECVEHLTCLEPYEDDYYDWNEEETEPQGAVKPSPEFLAGPPPQRRRRSKPVTRYNAVNLCSAEVACNAPRSCMPEKLCVPKGTRALAYKGSNINPARVRRMVSAPAVVASSTAPPVASSPPPSAGAPDAGTIDAGAADPGAAGRPQNEGRPLEGTAPISGGCAGCAVGEAPVSMAGIGLLALAALLWKRRR